MAPEAVRQADRGFYGDGCQHLGVGTMLEPLNELLMHYGCITGVGLKMQMLLEFFTL